MTEYESEKKPSQFTSREASAVNSLFGIKKEDVLPLEEMPRVINMGPWWHQAKPILDASSPKREIGFGWDLKSGHLEISEVIEGQTFDEITQPPVLEDLGDYAIAGNISLQPHLIGFHSHPLIPARFLKKEAFNPIGEFLSSISNTNFVDMGLVVREPQTYADIVINNMTAKTGKRSVTLALKTISSPVLTPGNTSQFHKILKNIALQQLLDIDETITWQELLPGGKHTLRYMDILLRDKTWRDYFGLAIYRGFLSDDLREPQIIRRSDTRPTETISRNFKRMKATEKFLAYTAKIFWRELW